MIAAAAERAVRPEPWFWRTHAGAEVDLLVAHGRRVLAVEVKLGSTVGARDVAGLRSCMADLKLRHAIVVYTGEEQRAMGRGISLVPWVSIARGDFELPM